MRGKRFIELRKHAHLIAYAFLSILILSNLLFPGELFMLDFAVSHDPAGDLFAIALGYNEDMGGVPAELQEALPYFLFSMLFSFAPAWVFEKLFFFLILFLSGVTMYYACPTENRSGKFFAGLLYMINPFIYIRFLAGHVFLLLSYAFLPFLVKSIFDLSKKENVRLNIFVAAVALWFSTMMIQLIPLIVALCVLIVAFTAWAEQNNKVFKRFACVLILWCLLSAPFLAQQLLNQAQTRETLSKITLADLYVFSTKPDSTTNALYNAASLYGFWRPGYILAKESFGYLQGIVILFIFLAVYGFSRSIEARGLKGVGYALAVMAVFSLIFAVSTSVLPVGEVNKVMDAIPFLKAFREPHKALAFVALAYAFFGGIGVGGIVSAIRSKRVQMLVIGVLLLAPIAYTFTMFNGFFGQLDSVSYPDEYYAAEKFFNADADDFNILVLPWHLYMDYSWYPKQRIVNPARFLFSKPVIYSDAIEVGQIYSQTTKPISLYVQRILYSGRKQEFGKQMSLVNVKYIVLFKEADYNASYDFLSEQKDLKLIQDSKYLKIFENKEYAGRIQRIGGGYLKYEKQLPVRYAVETDAEQLIFKNAFSEKWFLGENDALNYSEAVNTFTVPKTGRKFMLGYSSWIPALASFCISIITVITCALAIAYFYTRSRTSQ